MGSLIGVAKPTSQRLGKLDTLGKLQAHFHFNALKATIGTTLNITIGGTLFNRALAQGGTALAVHSLGDFLAGELGQAYSLGKGELGYLPHKLLHGILGASVGAGMHKALGTDRGGNLGESALGGALGALMAEVVAEATLGEDLGLRVVETARLRGEKLTQDTYAQALEAAVHRSQLWGQLAGGITALVAGQDVDAAVLSATHATENNFIPAALKAGGAVWAAYDVYDTYCQHGPEVALTQGGVLLVIARVGGLGLGVCFKVGGVVYSSAAKAWTAYLAHNPHVARVAQVLGGKAVSLQGKVVGSKVSQTLVKLDHKADTALAKVWPGGAKRLSQSAGQKGLGKTRPNGKYFQKHHIISDKNLLTKEHPLWELAGMHPTKDQRIMFLPTPEGAKISTTSRSLHLGRQLKSVNEEIAQKMDAKVTQGLAEGWDQAQYRSAIEGIIREEKALLKSGLRMLNKHHRPWAEHPLKKGGH
jgi:hypothetical protein